VVARVPDDVSNSRSACKIFTRGLDTVSLAWRGQGSSRLMSTVLDRPSFRSGRGVVLADTPPSGMRVMAWPEHGLVAAEGRLGAILDDDRRSYRLAPTASLLDAERAMRAQMLELTGHQPDGDDDCEVRRYDLTSEAHFDHPAEGRAFLRALGGMCPPRYKLMKVEVAEGVETVYVITPKRARKIARAYDKGVESGSHPAGERVRFEAQLRPPTAQRHRPAVLARRDLRRDFGRTLAPFLVGSEITVSTPDTAVRHLAGQMLEGKLRPARAERLVGSIGLLRAFGRAIYGDDATSARRLRQLREAGVVLDDALPDDAQVPVSKLLSEMVDAWSAEASTEATR
jgi:hypothetical protein